MCTNVQCTCMQTKHVLIMNMQTLKKIAGAPWLVIFDFCCTIEIWPLDREQSSKNTQKLMVPAYIIPTFVGPRFAHWTTLRIVLLVWTSHVLCTTITCRSHLHHAQATKSLIRIRIPCIFFNFFNFCANWTFCSPWKKLWSKLAARGKPSTMVTARDG